MQYVLSPSGDFERGSWRTTGNASAGQENETFNVGGAGHARSLHLSDGSAATSEAMCVGIEHPTVRFFVRQIGGGGVVGGHVDVDVLFEDANGNVQSLQIAKVSATSNWNPTAAFPILVNLLPLLPGEKTAVAFRVTARDGSFRVDDFYVDPYNKG